MILIDQWRPTTFRRFRRTAHVMSDLPGQAGTDELDAFVAQLGLRKEWRQNTGEATEHYDLFDAAIARALVAGATLVSTRDLVLRVVRPKRALQCPTQS